MLQDGESGIESGVADGGIPDDVSILGRTGVAGVERGVADRSVLSRDPAPVLLDGESSVADGGILSRVNVPGSASDDGAADEGGVNVRGSASDGGVADGDVLDGVNVPGMEQALALGPRALVLFGSYLSPATRRPGSIPDLLALVDDVDTALATLGAGRWARRVAPLLPPVTLALRAHGRPLAKLNLVSPSVLATAIARPRDLYLAGRLSKQARLVHARDAACAAELERLVEAAVATIAGLALCGLPRRVPLEALVRRCFELSYLAEVRPESAARRDAAFTDARAFYHARFAPPLRALAAARGLGLVDGHLVDERADHVRDAEARALGRLIRRGRWRSMARWPKQALVYRGWLPYVVGKLRRARGA